MQAPKGYGAEDQRARQMAEILRWERSFGADVVALQECEEATAYRELQRRYELVGTAEAVANRGFVHVYVRRRDDIEFERLDVGAVAPCVAVRIDFGSKVERGSPLCWSLCICLRVMLSMVGGKS